MIAHLGKRIEALEIDATRPDHHMQVILAEAGETGDQARQRMGIDADAKDIMLVVFG